MILIVSYPGEDHTEKVMQCLEQKGREVLMMDMSDFPANKGMSLSWASSNKKPIFFIDNLKLSVDLNKINALWWRRLLPFTIDHELKSQSNRAFAESETSQAIYGMLDSLNCNWINPRAADEAAHHKPLQWSTAKKIGLKLPQTLVTNKPDDARNFINAHGIGRVVFKAFLASTDAWRETRLVLQEDVERLELVRFAPVIFQEYIEGVDLRITIIGDQVFSAEIDAQKTSYPVDMRMVIGETEIQVVKLPKKIEQGLRQLQLSLGLKYGAIDMRRTPNGEYYFLEVNPAGQWLFVERGTGLPISQAMADYLITLDK